MYLLIDECCGKGLVKLAQSLGHTAQRTIEARALGRSASDPEIHRFACMHGAVVVTNNRPDFKRLARDGGGHPGMILLPSVVAQDAVRLFAKALPVAAALIESTPNMIVEIDEEGAVSSFQLP